MADEVSGLSEAIPIGGRPSPKNVGVLFDVSSPSVFWVFAVVQFLMHLVNRVVMRYFYSLEVIGSENLEGIRKPMLIVANHKSYFDPLVVSDALPITSAVFPIRFMGKDQLFTSWLSRAFYSIIGTFPAFYGQGMDKSLAASEVGAEGHSDADVLTHAVTDAILGALALGDIGSHFPNTDERWRNVESFVFLKYAVGLMKERGFRTGNVDATVSIERPKLAPFIEQMRGGLAAALEVSPSSVSVKAKTNEGLGAVGEMLAVRAEAVVLLEKQVVR